MEVSIEEVLRQKRQAKWFMIIAAVILLIGSYTLYNEISGARSFCNSVNGTPSLTGRFCNGEELAKYPDGWDFRRFEQGDKLEINISDLP